MKNWLSNITGQDFVCNILQEQLSSQQISHAYLFVGPKSCGKLNCAKALAKSLLPEDAAAAIDTDTYIDVKIFEPQGINAYLAGQIKEIIADSQLAPSLGQRKIYIIKDAEKLGSSAANAFLKTLEEPAVFNIFILLAQNESGVLPTIVSRCQLLKFNNLTSDQAQNVVQKETGAAPNDAKTALELFGGNTNAAIDFCLDQNMQDYHQEIVHIFNNIHNLDHWALLQRSADVVAKINEIVKVYSNSLDQNIKDIDEVLDASVVKAIQKQNKSLCGAKQKFLLRLLLSSLSIALRDCINLSFNEKNNKLQKAWQSKYVSTLNLLSSYQAKLAYNVSVQNFCDVVFLNTKRALT